MIKVQTFRKIAGEEVFFSTHEQDVWKSVESLCVFELGYGGHITKVDKIIEPLYSFELGCGEQVTKVNKSMVEVVTTVMQHCQDRTVFTGSEEDMLPLVKAATAAALVEQNCHEQIIHEAANALEQLPENVRGVPLMVVNLAPFLMGFHPALAGLLAAGDITQEKDARAIAETGLGLKAVMYCLYLKTQGFTLNQSICNVADVMKYGVKEGELMPLATIARKHALPFRQVLAIAWQVKKYGRGLKLEDIPTIISLADETSIVNVIKQMSSPASVS